MSFIRNETFKVVLLYTAVSLLGIDTYSRFTGNDETNKFKPLLKSVTNINQQLAKFQNDEDQPLLDQDISLYSAGDSVGTPGDFTTVPPSTPSSSAREATTQTHTIETCKEVDKIYFLKTSKTGSTSVANLLMRFGLRRPGTTFLLGETPNGGLFFENKYMPFNAESCYLGQEMVLISHVIIFLLSIEHEQPAVRNLFRDLLSIFHTYTCVTTGQLSTC